MTRHNIHDLTTATAYDRDGEKLGSVKEIYINDDTGQPDFAEVSHGLFGMRSSIVPLRGHSLVGEELKLAFSKDQIKDAPHIRHDEHLSEEDHAAIYRHYGLEDVTDVHIYERPDPESLAAQQVPPAQESPEARQAERTREYRQVSGTAQSPGPQETGLSQDPRESGDTQETLPPAAPGSPAGESHGEGKVLHGFGDAPRSTGPPDRLRSESDHALGLDRTPEDRAMRGTSSHGMSDEAREQDRWHEVKWAEGKHHQSDQTETRSVDAGQVKGGEHPRRPAHGVGDDASGVRDLKRDIKDPDDVLAEEFNRTGQDEDLSPRANPGPMGPVDDEGRPLDEGDQNYPRSAF